MGDVLTQICLQKKALVEKRKADIPKPHLEYLANIQSPPRGFIHALEKSLKSKSYGLIAEIKKASPSQGLIRQNFDPISLATAYQQGGATCISVLTDTPYFQGSDQHLSQAREAVDLPVIRKDFIIDPYQILESRAIGADCILIIMAAVSNAMAAKLYTCAKEFGMDVLVEVHSEEEMGRALDLDPDPDLVGINNRNLKTLEVDLATTEKLIPMAPKGSVIVSESGLYSNNDLQRLSAAGANCFLVGESLMRQENVANAVQVLLGDNMHYKHLDVVSHG